jgi:F420-0:gamma-glutamyl ligase-like protein
MAKFFFHFSSKKDRIEDRRGVYLAGPYEAHQHAVNVIRKVGLLTKGEPWRDWVIDITDADGQNVLTVPFLTNVLRRGFRNDIGSRRVVSKGYRSERGAKATEGE